MRYLDSATRHPDQTLQRWLEDKLPSATLVAVQTGYFVREGLTPIRAEIDALLARGGQFHLVVGANEAGVYDVDLKYVLDIIDGYPPKSASLVLAGAVDALFHPKTFYVETDDGRRHALVGSANLTGSGLAGNIEAALVASSDIDNAPFEEIRDAILVWGTRAIDPTDDHSFEVTKTSLPALLKSGAVSPVAAKPPRRSTSGASGGPGRPFGPVGRILPRVPAPAIPATVGGAGPGVAPPIAPVSPPIPVSGIPTFPSGAIGIVKHLSHRDVRTFTVPKGITGFSISPGVAAFLNMLPSGKNQEPRLDINLAFEVDNLPGQHFTNQMPSSQPNITFVGVGLTRTGHKDLRLNYLISIVRQISAAAALAKVRVPQAGDLAAIEFQSQNDIRIVIATLDPLRAQLATIVTNSGSGGAWLPPGVV